MQLWQAERTFEGPLRFGSQWHIEARDVLKVKADIERLQRELLRWSCEWEDLPFRGRIFRNRDFDQLIVLRDMYREQAALGDFPNNVMEQLVTEGVI